MENRASRQDFDRMQTAYTKFLSMKSKGKPLSAKILPGTLAVFESSGVIVGCAIISVPPGLILPK